MKGSTKFKKLSELPSSVRAKLYSLRLKEDMNKPIDEYLEMFDTIVVEDCMYHSDSDYGRNIAEEYRKAEENHSDFKMMALPMVVMKDGLVIKNRFGEVESEKPRTMTEKFVKETIFNYEKLDDRARHVAELLKIDKGWFDKIEFNDDTIDYTFGYTCMNETDYDYATIPMKYMWMEDDDVIADYKAEQKRKEEEAARKKELEEQRKKEAREKAERTMYEKLKEKFEVKK
jgi:hypothetical protein